MHNNKITDEQFFSLLEGDISKSEEKQLLAIIEADKELTAEWKMWQLTINEEETPTFDQKAALFAIPEKEEKRALIFWVKWASVAAILLIGFLSFWMLNQSDNYIDGMVKVGQDSTKHEERIDEESLVNDQRTVKPMDAQVKIVEESGIKIKYKGIEDTPKGEQVIPDAIVPENIVKIEVDTLPNKIPEKSIAKENNDTSVNVALPNIEPIPSSKVEVVLGTKVSKKKLNLRKLLAFRDKAKKEVNEWVEKPQLGFVKGMNSKSALNVGNKKYKLNLKLSNYE